MKLNLLLVINYLKKILITIISLSVFLTPALAFASDDSPSPEQAPLEVESAPDPWLSLETKTMELRATERTITDVYNIITTGLMSGNNPKLDNIYSLISDCLEFYTDSPLHRYTIADLQGMTWQIASSINNQLTSTNSILGNIYNNIGTTNAKLEYVFSAIEDTINIKWYEFPFTYRGVSTSLNGSYLTSDTTAQRFYVNYYADASSINNRPYLLRFYVPIEYYRVQPLLAQSVFSLVHVYGGATPTTMVQLSPLDYFLDITTKGFYLYLFDFDPFFYQYYSFEIACSGPSTFRSSLASTSFYIPFDTLDYQIIKTAFYQAKSANSLDELKTISSTLSTLASNVSSGSQAAEALADFFVSPEKQAAEDASQQVINSTLNNFTGSGSGAAKSSDSNAMKDISVSVKSGINGGGSTSNATDVLNPSSVSGQTFWIWFSTTTKNNVENPYPAPIVNNTRKSSDGDEIIDTLSGYQEQLKNLLGGDSK